MSSSRRRRSVLRNQIEPAFRKEAIKSSSEISLALMEEVPTVLPLLWLRLYRLNYDLDFLLQKEVRVGSLHRLLF